MFNDLGCLKPCLFIVHNYSSIKENIIKIIYLVPPGTMGNNTFSSGKQNIEKTIHLVPSKKVCRKQYIQFRHAKHGKTINLVPSRKTWENNQFSSVKENMGKQSI